MIVKGENKQIFAILSFSYCLLLALLFKPITWQAQGDAAAYIELAKQFLHTSTENIDLSHRQPLYSGLLAIAIFLFGEDGFLYPVLYFQYFLVFISSIIIYKIFTRFSANSIFPMLTGLAYLINLSTLYYGYSILSETISLFLFVAIIYLLLVYSEKRVLWIIILLGALNGLLVLARFNAIGVPFITLIVITLIHFRNFGLNRSPVYLRTIVGYFIPLLLILNVWCTFNYINRGFYGLFPSSNIEQRWAIPASINKNNIVPDEYKQILEIFLRANDEYTRSYPRATKSKGSLSDSKYLRKIYESLSPDVNGYSLFKIAKKELLIHYKLENNPDDLAVLGTHLKPFYSIIKKQNASILFKYRIYSFVSSFRASGTALPTKEKINLNVLPDITFKIYKILFLAVALITYLLTGIYLLKNIWRIKMEVNLGLLIISVFLWYFPLIHFYANVLGDASRFKYPVEPLIFGLFIFSINKLINWIGARRKVEILK